MMLCSTMDGSVKTLVKSAQLIAACCGFHLVGVAFQTGENSASGDGKLHLFLLAAGSGIYGLDRCST